MGNEKVHSPFFHTTNMKTMWMMLFFALPLIAISYISWHIWCLLPLSSVWKALIIICIVGCFLLTFANFSRSTDGMPMPVATFCYEVANSSLIILLYLFMLFLLLDLGRLVRLVPRTLLYNNWATAIGIFVLMTILFTYGYFHYMHKYREEIQLTAKKPLAKPLKLVMMSDLHIGYHNRREELHRWIDIINSEQPDLVLIAGDIIDMSLRPIKEERMYEEFHRLNAPVYACIGNHEFYSGEVDAQEFYKQAGIRLLQDSCAIVGDLCIIGRDDRTNRHRKTLADLMKQADRTKYTILLDHQPYFLEQTERQTSSSADILITDKYGLSHGLQKTSMSVLMVLCRKETPIITFPRESVSGVGSSASEPAQNMW